MSSLWDWLTDSSIGNINLFHPMIDMANGQAKNPSCNEHKFWLNLFPFGLRRRFLLRKYSLIIVEGVFFFFLNKNQTPHVSSVMLGQAHMAARNSLSSWILNKSREFLLHNTVNVSLCEAISFQRACIPPVSEWAGNKVGLFVSKHQYIPSIPPPSFLDGNQLVAGVDWTFPCFPCCPQTKTGRRGEKDSWKKGN